MQLKLLLLLIVFGFCGFVAPRNFREEFYNGFKKLVNEGKESTELKNALQEVKFPHMFRGYYKPKQRSDLSNLVCQACDVVFDIVITASRDGVDLDQIADAVAYVCINLGIENEEICNGVININKHTLSYIMNDNNTKATSKRICSMMLKGFNCPSDNEKPWTINIPPAVDNIKLFKLPQRNTDTFKVVQLTDFHYDPNYEVGSNADCSEPLCCQKGSKPKTREAAAGYWGDYRNCDLPWHSVVDTLDHIVLEHRDIDYVYFTGDIINHKVWQTDIESNKVAISKVLKQFKRTFGNLPVYPILGNHEPHPVNLFSYDVENSHEINTKWVFELSAEEWSHWLPEDTRETILKGGYYTVKVREGFRIIALNSNVCFTLNFWLFYDDVDPFGQLQWLADTLAEAEIQNEKVHILSHVPTGDSSCLQNWGTEYVKIINRFHKTISAQFNGHTHNDEMVVFFSDDNMNPINIAFNGGSLTTYSNLNPNYKVFEIDANSFDVLDYESWIYNITHVNRLPQLSPNWRKLYSFKEQYELQHVDPVSLADLVGKMALEGDSKLINKYYRYKNREADTALAAGCDADCHIENLCYMVTYVAGHDFHCKRMTDSYNSAHPPKPKFNRR